MRRAVKWLRQLRSDFRYAEGWAKAVFLLSLAALTLALAQAAIVLGSLS